MKSLTKRCLAWLTSLLVLTGLLCSLVVPAQAATVDYVYSGSYIKNWGVRDTVATFLSPNAEAFYEDNNVTYDQLAALSGSSSVSSVPSSALYNELQDLMVSNHSNPTSYNATRNLFQHTDCQNSGKTSSKISSFYSGALVGPAWDSGATWNREHTWPNSKGLEGRDEDDIMMLRPTSVSENSSRGNTAYGESGSYYDPNQLGQSLHGDVARIMLYQYVRWGNTSYMWGASGVMESKAVLLKWMEEDPVDTWELGRNDSVESITGTRNVFVDYPELAFALFNEEVPSGYATPSGGASSGTTPDTPECTHAYDNACDTNCNLCGATRTTKHTYTADCDTFCDVCGAERTVSAGGEHSLSFSTTANRTSYSTAKQVWQQNGITVTNNKAAASSNVADYYNPVRFYASSEVIVAYPGMTKIVFTCSGSSYATALKNSITTGTVSSSGSTVTVTFAESVDTFTIAKLSAQTRVSSIKVTSAGAQHVFTNDSDPDCNVCGTLRLIDSIRLYDPQVLPSRMEMNDGVGGLAFKFEAYVSGAAKNEQYEGDLTAATVNYGGVTCKVLAMGAVVSNDPTVGGDAAKMVRESVKADKTVVDVPARLLYQCETDSCFFAVRITNIPEKHFDTAIYARPYCVIAYNGQVLTVYDNIVYTTYNG